MKKVIKKLVVMTLAIVVLSSCNNDDDSIPDGQGKVKVVITDAPFPFDFVKHAKVGVSKVELKTNSGEFIVVYEGNASYDMLGLTNGATAEVETTNIEAGTYGQARVTLNSASVELSNGTTYDLNSEATASSFTISIEPALVVEEGDTSEVLFDLDVNESFRFHGNSIGSILDWITSVDWIKGCHFNPQFRVCDRDQTGEISGTVTVGGNNEENTQVYVTVNGHEIYTHSKANGSFRFIGVNPGTYTVYVKTKHGHSAHSGEVTVTAGSTATCTVKVAAN